MRPQIPVVPIPKREESRLENSHDGTRPPVINTALHGRDSIDLTADEYKPERICHDKAIFRRGGLPVAPTFRHFLDRPVKSVDDLVCEVRPSSRSLLVGGGFPWITLIIG